MQYSARKITHPQLKIALSARIYAEGHKSSRIPEAISVGNAENVGNGTYRINIIVDLKVAPQAAAFEFGSDPHVIAPKEVGALAFVWKGHPASTMHPSNPVKKYIGPGMKGLLFTYVDHPGIVARPYLRPAIDDNILAMHSKLSQVSGQAISLTIKAGFENAKKK